MHCMFLHKFKCIVGGDAVFRLVEKDVALALGSHYLAVVFHNIVAGDFSSKFGHNLPVDLHFSSGDVLVGFATGTYSGICHIFVETKFRVRIDVLKNIIDLLGTRCELHALIPVVETALLTSALAETALLTVVLAETSLLTVLVAALPALLVATLTNALN